MADERASQLDAIPPTERWTVTPPEGGRRYGTSTVFMPDGSAVCVSQAAPDELTLAMTLAWNDAWKKAGREREPRIPPPLMPSRPVDPGVSEAMPSRRRWRRG